MTGPHRRAPHTPSLPAWHVATSDSVRAILANAYARDEPPTSIGAVTLMPHQRDALARVRTTIREFHGALLADEVGLGKTYVALALAHDYEQAHVIAPAALLPMWRTAIARTASQHIQLHSLHGFSRTPAVKAESQQHGATPYARNALVVIDEAHHLRTRNTRRYRAIADFVAGRDLLLLSATPIHNTAHELRHLLALFAGLRDDLLAPESLARLIIRQTTASRERDPTRARHDATPSVHEHPPLGMPHDRATLDLILALPAPLPARDGAVAGALIRLGLLRAWCSSDSALGHVLRRRLLRGEALKQALIAGRHPTHAELRSWLVGEHEVQLAFPELLTEHAAENGPLLDVLTRHLDALESLLEHHHRHRSGDTARANALRGIMAKHPDTPIIAFSQFTRTVQSLYRALSDIAGVGALTGMHGQIASGRIARLDAITRFAPTAQGRPPPPPHQAIRLLLTTDILAEGVNLQDAQVVVHLDLPWTDAVRRQRVGRVARIGSRHAVVHVYSFAPPPGGNRALALTARLVSKAALSSRFVGQPGSGTPDPPPSTPLRARPGDLYSDPPAKPPSQTAPADLATALHAALQSWRATASPNLTSPRDASTDATYHPALESPRSVPALVTRNPNGYAPTTHASIPVAELFASRPGWLAAILTSSGTRLVAHTDTTGTEPARIWQLVSAFDATGRQSIRHPNARDIANALRQLHIWLADRDIANATGPTPAAVSRAQTLALRRLAQLISSAPPLARTAQVVAIRTAEQVIRSAAGIGAELALEAWARHDLTAITNGSSSPSLLDSQLFVERTAAAPSALSAWLAQWRGYPALCSCMPAAACREDRVVTTPASTASSPAESSALDRIPAPSILALLHFRTPRP